MFAKRDSRSIVCALVLLAALAPAAVADPARERDDRARPGHPVAGPGAWIRHWNRIAIDASGLDHTPVAPGESRVFGEQFGPGRASRAMAIVHVAMFDALVAIEGGYRSYTGLPRVRRATSVRAALAQAAHDTLVAVFPSQAPAFDEELRRELRRVPRGRAKTDGVALGRRAAEAILALRADDGAQHAEPLVDVEWPTSPEPGRWRQDPVSLFPYAIGAHWGEVRPFVLASADQFRPPPPPALDSPEYAAAFDEVKRVGGDGVNTATERSEDETVAGIYWAYDGTPALCAPPRLYNQIALEIARVRRSNPLQTARLLALVNLAMADAGIAAWEAKYLYDFWRPVLGIREADPGTGPTGAGDGNPATQGDPAFSPLGAPASNLAGANFTPPFPAYPSGHATFGGAVFQTLRRFYGTDDVAFTFVSDEWNGVTTDNAGNVRPLIPRSFDSLSAAEDENGQSRIWLGIHWRFDKTEGIALGRQVADYVFDHAYRPVQRGAFRR
jgi:hypothetical protein